MKTVVFPQSWGEVRALRALGFTPHLPEGATTHDPMVMGYYHHYSTFGVDFDVEWWLENHPEAENPPRHRPGQPFEYGWNTEKHGHLFQQQCPFRFSFPDLWRLALIQGHRFALSGQAVDPGDLAYFYCEMEDRDYRTPRSRHSGSPTQKS